MPFYRMRLNAAQVRSVGPAHYSGDSCRSGQFIFVHAAGNLSLSKGFVLVYHRDMAASAYTFYTYASPHGPITLRASSRGLVEVVFAKAQLEGAMAASAITNQAATELQEYLAGKRRTFSVRLDPQGSSFQKAVWECACEIPYGETRTPSDIAAAIGKPGSHRSVGTALKQNRLAPFVPTHRLVLPSATGKQANLFRALCALEQRALGK